MPIELSDSNNQQGERKKRAPLVPIEADAPKRPDFKAHKAELDKIFEQIKGYKEQLDVIRKKADESRNSKNNPRQVLQDEKKKLIDDKRELGDEIGTLRGERNAAMDRVRAARNKSRDEVSEIRKLNKELGELLTPEAVDKKIKDLEFKLETGAVSSIKGEKKVMLEIKALRASRDKASSMSDKINSVTGQQKEEEDFAQKSKTIQRQIDEKSIQFKELLQQIEDKNTEISKLSNAGEAKKAREERDEISQKITNSYEKLDANRKNFDKKKQAFEEWQVEYDKKCQAERERRRKEKVEQDRLRAEKAKEKELEIASIKRLNPHEEEINGCETLIVYLKTKIAFASREERKTETKPAFDPTANVASGFTVMKKDDDAWLMGGKKKKEQKPKQPSKPKEPVVTKSKKVSHSHEKLTAFDKMGLKLPTNTDEVKETIEKLITKKKHWESFKKTEKEAIEEEIAERKAAEKAKAEAEAEAEADEE